MMPTSVALMKLSALISSVKDSEEISVTHQLRRSEAESSELASRLRSLRLHHWDQAVNQLDLGRVLGVGISSVSSWENTDAPKIPPEVRLRGYASFFASHRSLDSHPPRLLRDDELTDEERGERDKLFAELRHLRAAAADEIDQSAANVTRSGKTHRKRRGKRTGGPPPRRAATRKGETRPASPLPENSPGQGTGGVDRDLRDLIALALILAVPTILIIVGDVGVAVIVAAAQFVVLVLRAWWWRRR